MFPSHDRARCGKPSINIKHKLPKKFSDPIYYEFELDKQELKILKQGLSAMGAEHFEIKSDDGETVTIRIVDIEGDVLKKELDSELTIVDADADEEMNFSYIFKILLPLLTRAVEEGSKIEISRKGVIRLIIAGLSIYIFAGTD